jgi:DNA-binding transcriptional ArsR family regulator
MIPSLENRLDHVYAALSDATRRAILERLAKGDLTVGELADRFPISLNGVSKHVKVLERAGLVDRTIAGRHHRLHLRTAPLADATRWLNHYRVFWEKRLAALEVMLAGSPEPGPTRRRRTPRR